MDMKPYIAEQAKKAAYTKPAVSELSTEATHGGATGTVEGAAMTAMMRKFNAS